MKEIQKIIIVSAVSIIVAGTAGFFIGKHAGGFGPRMGNGFPVGDSCEKHMSGNIDGSGKKGGKMKNGSVTSGEVISKDDNGFVIKLQNGESKTVITGEELSVSKSVSGTTEDISIGKTVFVKGATKTDGSIEAELVNIKQCDEHEDR